MKSYISALLAVCLSCVSFASEMDGQPEAAPLAGTLIGNDPVKQQQCDELKSVWKAKYEEISKLNKKQSFVSQEKQNDLDDTTNSLVELGCIKNTDKLKEEVDGSSS